MPAQQNRVRESLGQTRQRMFLASDMEIRAVEGQDRTFELSFSSETPVNRWWGTEILSHSEGAPNLDRLNNGGCLLYNHDTSIESLCGPINKAWLDVGTRKCRAIVTFDTDDDAEKIFQKVQSGTLRNVSFMYSLDAIEEVKAGATSSDGRFQGPCEIVTQWTAYEITFTPVPADNSVGVGRSAEEASSEQNDEATRAAAAAQNNANGQEASMPGTVQDPKPVDERGAAAGQAPAAGAVAEPVGETREQMEERIRSEEITRQNDIRTICRGLNIDEATTQGYIDQRKTVDEVRKAVLDVQMERMKPSAVDVQVGRDRSDDFRDAIPLGIQLRAGRSEAQLRAAGFEDPNDAESRAKRQAAERIRHMTIRALMEEDARMRGRMDAAQMSPMMLMRDVLTPDSAFVAVLDHTVGASVMMGHHAAQTTYQIWVRFGSLPNTKATPAFRMSEAGAPELVKQSGEYAWDEMTDEGISRKLNFYAVGWGFTEECVLNDDLSILTDTPMAHAIATERKINRDVYTVWNASPAIYDGIPLFDARHGNLAAQGAPPTVLTVDAGREAMAVQQGIRELQTLNISPRYAILGSSVVTPGQQLIAATNDPAATTLGVPNPEFVRNLIPVSDAEITDRKSWGLAADPNVCDTIQVELLNGNRSPRIEMAVSFDIFGLKWRLSHYWGVTVKDFRGLYKNPGA